MKLYDNFSAYDSFFVCGDIHGEFKTLLYEIKRKGISDAIILLDGDCGIGFEEPEYFQNSFLLTYQLGKYIIWIVNQKIIIIACRYVRKLG